MSIFVRFWGVRGSIPTPGRSTRRFGGNTSCVEIRTEDHLFICDAGTGLRQLGIELGKRPGDTIEAHMFFSHMHWDHIQGFPFFMPAYGAQNTFHVYETSGEADKVTRLLEGQMRSDYFPVDFKLLASRIIPVGFRTGEINIGDVTVRSATQEHPGGSYAFSFEREGKKVVYATDNELDLWLEDPELPLREPDKLRPLPQDFVSFVRGADLLIADGQYTDEEYPRKKGWGHPRASTLVDLAIQAQVRQLAIFHHDPMHTDSMVDEKIDNCRMRAERLGVPLVIFGAREGLELKIF